MCQELAEYLEPRGRTAKVAREAHLAPGFVSQIATGTRPAPPWFVPAIERATEGLVRRWHLRPLDWHLIWPELIGTPGAPPIPTTVAEEARDAA